jgi:LuxR family transcriptional regulator, maltose regulon positive regulatory protein
MRVARSKLHPPQLGRPVIDRTWLFHRPIPPAGGGSGVQGAGRRDRGGEHSEVPVTLLSAPAGSGKTTLMARWAEDRAHHGHRVGWLSLDDSDNDRAVFWTGVLAAVRSTVTGEQGGSGWTDDRDHPVDVLHLPPLVQLEQLVGASPAPLWLFLDDLQEVHAADVLTDVAGLLRGIPPGLQLVLASRRDPAVALHRLALAGRLREIRASDLALDRREVQQVLLHHGVRLAEQPLSLLVDRTEGWAAGVRLAALSLAGATDPQSLVQDFVGDERAVADYLAAEVLARLSSTDRALLRLCAVPEQLTADLARAVTDDPTAPALLERLYRDNVLVERLVQPGWYRMHSLLRGHLIADVRRTDPELLATAHRRSADWFARHGLLVWAITHGVAVADDALAVQVLVDHGPTLLADGRARELDRLIGSSSPVVQADADVHELATVTSLELGPPSSPVIPGPRRPWAATSPQPEQPWPGPDPTPLGALASLQQARHGDLARSGTALAASAAVADGRVDDLGLLLRLNRGLVSLLAGDLPEADSELTSAATQAARRDNGHALLQATAGLTALASSRGDYRSAWLLADQTVRIAGRLRAFRSVEVATALLQAAQTAYQQLDRTGARRLAERARSALTGSSDVPVEIALTTLVAVLDVDDGRQPADATRRIRSCWALVRGQPIPVLLVMYLVHSQHRCSWLVGRPDWAREALDELRQRAGPGGDLEVLIATEHLSRGRGDAARSRLAPVLDGRTPCAYPLSLQQGWLAEAVLSAQAGQRARAHEALAMALGIAEEQGALRPFVDMPGVAALLDEDVSRFGRLDHVAASIRSARQDHGHVARPALTPRELQLLTDLPAQLTLEEIADRHQVSVNTVKTHVRSIYLKLGAQSRRQAVASARRRGLL